MQQCPFCSSQIQEGLGTCPYCNENLLRHQVPAAETPTAKAPALPDTAPTVVAQPKHPCPHCGESIDVAATVCRYCGLEPQPRRAPERRPCPYCAESILATSRLCRFCGCDVTQAPDPNAKRPCPHCKEPIAATDLTCRYCGNDARVKAPAGRKHIDWEDSKRNVFARWWATWAGTQFGADRFWSAVPFEGGYGPPTKFALFYIAQWLMLAAVCGVAIGGVFLVGVLSEGKANAEVAQGVGIALAAIAIGVPLLLGMTVVLLYMVAGVHHVFVLMLGGRGGFEATFRVTSYSFGTHLWNWIPYAGGLVQLVFHLLACTHGFAHAHGFSKGRAFAAAGLPVLAFCGLSVGGVIAMIALG